MLHRVGSRVRRVARRPGGLRPVRPWAITIGPPAPAAQWSRIPSSPLRGWLAHRTSWSIAAEPDTRLPAWFPVVYLDASSWEWLRSFAGDPLATRRAREVHIRIADWRAPMAGWSGPLGYLPGLVRSDVRLQGHGSGVVAISITLRRERSLREVVSAALDVVSPGRPVPAAVSATVASHGGAPGWLWPGLDVGIHLDDPTDDGERRPNTRAPVSKARTEGSAPTTLPFADVELVPDGASQCGFGEVPTMMARVSATGVEGASRSTLLIDLRGVATRRWRAPAESGLPMETAVPADVAARREGTVSGRLLVRTDGAGPRWAIVPAGMDEPEHSGVSSAPDVGWRPLGAPLDAAMLTALPPWWSVTCDGLAGISVPEAAMLVARVAATGVVVDGTMLPAAVVGCLSDELASVLRAPLPGPTAEAIEWEIRSVQQRRAVMRGHGTSLLLPGLLRPNAPLVGSPPSVTALLVTRRPSFAVTALRMLADQSYPALQVIVGLHGVDRTPDLTMAAAALRMPADIIDIPAAATLGEALGIATLRAEGSIVTKVDDDDIYGPEHIWDLVLARALSGATVVGKGAEFVSFAGQGITVRRPLRSDVYGHAVAGATITLTRGDLEAVGGWRPVRRHVDRALLDGVLRAGGLIYLTWPIGWIVQRHGEGHTWTPTDDYFLRDVAQRWDGLPPYAEFGTHRPMSPTIR